MRKQRSKPLIDAERFTEERQRGTRERVHWFVEKATGTTVLHVGTASGVASILLARRGFTCRAVVVSDEDLAAAARELERESDEIRARVTLDLLTPTVGGGPYDTILFGDVLGLDLVRDTMVTDLVSLLAPEGRVLVAVPYAYDADVKGRKPLYIRELLELLETVLVVNEVSLADGNLYLVASKDPTGYALGRATIGEIEARLLAARVERHALAARLEATLSEAERLKKRLKSKADETVVLKEKLRKRGEVIAALRAKLKERAEDVQRLKLKLESAGARTKQDRRPVVEQ